MQIFECYSLAQSWFFFFFFLHDRVINPFRYANNCNPQRNIFSENINILVRRLQRARKEKSDTSTHSIRFILSLSTMLCVLLTCNVAPLKFETRGNDPLGRNWWIYQNVTMNWVSPIPRRFQRWVQVGLDTTNTQLKSPWKSSTNSQNVCLESNNVYNLL